jgi:diguanylate cyclase (GGDEF)-like protein
VLAVAATAVAAAGAGACGAFAAAGSQLPAVAAGGVAAALAAALGTAQCRALRAARSLALRDPLTGLPNRPLLDDRVGQALRQARRSGVGFALLVVDLDGFKAVNDVRGHEAGNQVLVSIARRLESVVRASDTVARVGGDEFVVVSLDTTNEDEAAALVGRIRTVLRRPYRTGDSVVEVDASIGWALYPADGATASELIACADAQMYATKRDGAADPVRGRRAPLDAGVIRELEDALERNELVVHYQPVLELPSGSVRAVEALVRRADGHVGLIGPAEFMPHVERTPLIRAVTLHVVAQALRDLATLRRSGHELGVSVNVPYRVLDDPELAAGLSGLLESGLERPAELTLEVIPTGPGAGAELDRLALERLVRADIRLSLDDFGRSSSLLALRQIPLAEVKVDAAFVHGLGRSRTDDAIVRTLVHLAHELGLIVVAKGVEKRPVWDAALTVGCDRAQGYYVQAPLPADELALWLDGSWPAVAAG